MRATETTARQEPTNAKLPRHVLHMCNHLPALQFVFPNERGTGPYMHAYKWHAVALPEFKSPIPALNNVRATAIHCFV